MRVGGLAPTLLNGANEVAVAAFLDGRIGFCDIAALVEDVVSKQPEIGLANSTVPPLEAIFEADKRARQNALVWLDRAA